MNKKIQSKLEKLPKNPGVYFHKDLKGEIIYVGKAANLRNRVRQYFQKSRYHDPKTDLLVSEIADIDWAEVETEADALFLEAELVRRYQPRYNILLRDDKSNIYIRIDYKSDYPTVVIVRRPLDDGAEYFGPYMNAPAIKRALKYLRKAFPYAVSKPATKSRVSLYYHLGLDPGLEQGKTSLEEYRANLRKLMQYFRGERVALIKDIERQMKKASDHQDFEEAAKFRNQLFSLKELNRQILFSDRELVDASRDMALTELADLVGLEQPPKRIEGFDISHMQGTDNVASMVVFLNGIPFKTGYRKFKMRLAGNDDFGHMREVIRRRLRDENIKKWGTPDFMLIDGGKGQLASALTVRNELGFEHLPMVGLAKRHEDIIFHKTLSVLSKNLENVIKQSAKQKAYVQESGDYLIISLPENSNIIKLLQRIRDESHRFAVSYHSSLKRTRQTASILDEIPGVGPIARKKIIKTFGSAKGAAQASEQELAEVIGPKLATKVSQYLSSYR